MPGRVPPWNARWKCSQAMPMPGPCCRSSARKNSPMNSISGPIRWAGRWQLRCAQLKPRRPITSRFTLLRWQIISLGIGLPSGALRGDLDVNFDGVGVAADRGGESGTVGQRTAARLQVEHALAGGESRRVELVPEGPLQAEFGAGEAVRGVGQGQLASAGNGHGDGRLGG